MSKTDRRGVSVRRSAITSTISARRPERSAGGCRRGGPHPSDAGEEVDVDRSCSPGLEHLAKAGAEQLLVVVEQLPELVRKVGDLVENVGTQGLSGSQARADEARDRIVRDALVDYPQRTPDERRLSVHEQRAKTYSS